MALYKRGTTWWIRFTTPTGQQIRRSAKTSNRKDAQHYHDALRAEAWKRDLIGEVAPIPRIWDDAVERWLDERGEYPSRQDDIYWLRWLDKWLRSKPLQAITGDMIDSLRRRKKAEGVSNRTVNAVLKVIRQVLKSAVTWGWLAVSPPITMLPETGRRIRTLTEEEEIRLLAELPEHLAEITRFALATGLRMSNITQLVWDQVDLTARRAWIHSDQSKTGKAIAVPLNADAVLVLRRAQGKHPERVFTTSRGRPVNLANGADWRAAVKRAGLEDFCFHCLRHTFASRLAQAGVPLMALKELGGWSDVKTMQRYAHFSPDHLAEYSEKLCKPKLVAQIPHRRVDEKG
jgi:integrase